MLKGQIRPNLIQYYFFPIFPLLLFSYINLELELVLYHKGSSKINRMQKGEELGTGFEVVKFERHKMYYSTREKEY